MSTHAPAITIPCVLLLACTALMGCDRRQSDGHSATPPARGAASQAPAEAPADQSIQPAQRPPEPASDEAPSDADAGDAGPPGSR